MTVLDPAVAHASASLIAAHRRVVKDRNRLINQLQAEKGELRRALQAKAGEVVRAKMQAAEAFGAAANEAEAGDDLATALAATLDRAERAEQRWQSVRDCNYYWIDVAKTQRERAWKAEDAARQARAERDELHPMVDEQIKTIAELQRQVGGVPHIDDEAVERAQDTYNEAMDEPVPWWVVRAMLKSALTAPSRPEGAVELQALRSAGGL